MTQHHFVLTLLLPVTLGVHMGASIPDTKACCSEAGVSDFCVASLCDTDNPPNPFTVFDVASRCPTHLPAISTCLADGRDHMPCCRASARGLETQCLSLCDGTAKELNFTNWEVYKRYVACLTFNIKSMYECMEQGYLDSPDPPRDVAISDISHNQATVSWSPPVLYPDRTKQYIVYYIDASEKNRDLEDFHSLTTTALSVDLDDLRPDTRFVVYVVASGAGGKLRSQRSKPANFITQGVLPRITAHQKRTRAALGTTTTLVCKVQVYGSESVDDLSLTWSKGEVEITPQHVKFDSSSYILPAQYNSDGNIHIMALKINNVEEGDFDTYSCGASNSVGAVSSRITLTTTESVTAPSVPANVTACCVRENVHPSCLQTCRGEGGGDAPKPTAEPNLQCAFDVPKVLKCSTDGLNYETCCLRQRVPFTCLSLCDGTLNLPLTIYSCLMHTTSIITCHLEAKSYLPPPPSHVKIAKKTARSFLLQWKAVPQATTYYVYYRRIDPQTEWSRLDTAETSVEIGENALLHSIECVVVASNNVGLSDASKITRIGPDTKIEKDSSPGAEARSAELVSRYSS